MEPNCCYHGITPLIIAIENGNESIAKYLIEHGADVNNLQFPKYDHYYLGDQYTPLSLAINNGNEFIVKCLVEHGADVNKKIRKYYYKSADINESHDNYFPLDLAIKKGNKSIEAYLREHGAQNIC